MKKLLKKSKKQGDKKLHKKIKKAIPKLKKADISEFCDIENDLNKIPFWISGWGLYDVDISGDHFIADDLPVNMQKGAVIPVSNKYCTEYWRDDDDWKDRNITKLKESQFCADNLPDCAQIDVCQGDSGGPITWKVDRRLVSTQEKRNVKEDRYEIAGLVSYGHNCQKYDPSWEQEIRDPVSGLRIPDDDEDRLPGVYTRISSYVDWIKTHTYNTQTIYTNN